MEKRVHKRFLCFLVTIGLIAAGFMFGPEGTFAVYASSCTFGYGLYLGGQSATDYAKLKNGG